jgi:hypothetical protein
MEIIIILAMGTPLNTNDLNQIAKDFEPIAAYEKNIDLSSHTGFIPVNLGDKETGVESYKAPLSEIIDRLPPNESINKDNSLVIRLRWGGDMIEGATALYTAAIYTEFYNGIAFDPMSNTYIETNQLKQGYKAMMTYSD